MPDKRGGHDLTSGFSRFDFLLTFAVADPSAREALATQCAREWGGTQVGDATWEITIPGSPESFEAALEPFLRTGDRAVFYYLSDAKRFFRVVVIG